MQKFVILALFGLCSLLMDAQTLSRMATESEIRSLLAERIDVQHQSDAIVVGIITRHGQRVIGFGKFDGDRDPRVPDGETVFEIGSITKVFTSLLLSEMVLDGEVKLNDPVSKYLPPSVTMPTRNGKQITLLDLSMHTSGLPRMPSNFQVRDPSNPYADYGTQQMYEFLAQYKLTRDPGSKYDYSNLGAALLGQVLALRAGTDYATLLRTRITGPLGMNHTTVRLTPAVKTNLAPGHTYKLDKVGNWDFPAFAGAGGIRSTANDLLIFLAANLGFLDSPLQPAMKKQLSVHKKVSPGMEIAMGWHIINSPEPMAWHNGGTPGYHSCIAFSHHRKVGVVVLSNSTNSIDDLLQKILNYAPVGPVAHEPLPVSAP